MSLNFQNDAGKTRLRVLRQDVPWRAIRAFPNATGEALVLLQNVSGGVLGGDDLALSVDVGPCARVQLTSTGATRIHRCKPDGIGARQRTDITVEQNALLEYLPDSTILFADSQFHQSTSIQLEEGAGLIWWDMLAVGRTARGETFAFRELTSELAIAGPIAPLAIERFRLCPNSQDLTSPSRFGPFVYTATMYVCHISRDQLRWNSLEQQLRQVADELSTPGVRWGASTLTRDGIVVRGLGREAHLMAPGLYRFWREAKMAIWNCPASLPRKVH